MKVLHLCRSEPADLVRTLIDSAYPNCDNITVSLYDTSGLDYGQLVDEIFASERVVSWW